MNPLLPEYQRLVPLGPWIERCEAAGVARRAAAIAKRLHARTGPYPVGFTADFLLTTDARLLFLKGGPPHVTEPHGEPAAHPCAFAPGQISGIALSPRPGALTS